MTEEQKTDDIVDDTTVTDDQKSDDTKAPDDVLDDDKTVDKDADDDADKSTDRDVLSDDDDADDEGVPDSYTFDAPEGIEVNETILEEYKGVAKELGLTQKQFDGLAKYDLERTQASQQAATDGWNERVNGWREAARADKEFGGEAYDANVKIAMTAVNRFGDADLKALLKSPGENNPEGLAVGNHPAMLRFLHRIGKALADPDFVTGDHRDQDANSDDARLQRLYPTMFKDSA